jgi:hypothetical protein
LRMTHKGFNVKHEFGWVCSNCDIVKWYPDRSIRDIEFKNHVQKSSKCKNVIAKSDKQDVSPRTRHA